MTVHFCSAPGCYLGTGTGGDPDRLRCNRKGCPGAAGVHTKANRTLAAALSEADPGRAADVWRKRAEALAELADAHERSLADERDALSRLVDWVLAIRELVTPKASL